MGRYTTSLAVDRTLHEQMKKFAKENGMELYEAYNEALADYLRRKKSGEIDRIYAPIMEEILNTRLKRFEDRIATSVYKTAHDAAQLLYMLLPVVAEQLEEDPKDLYYRTRGIAAKHVKDKGLFKDE